MLDTCTSRSVILSKVTSETPTSPEGKETTRPPRRFPRSRVSVAERERIREDLREVSFPIGLRGYERSAVDRYVERVNRLIAELEISSSPESAIRHALDEVSDETRDILQRAHQAADELTARSRAKADDRLQEAERDAQELHEASVREAQKTSERAAAEAHEMRELASIEARELREASLRESVQLRDAAQREAEELRANARREVEGLLVEA